jgi:hypothetical protein
MAQLWYDVVSHQNGWAIVITPSRTDSFPNKKAAFDAAMEYSRKLRFLGYSVDLRTQPKRERASVKQARAS